MRSVARPSGRRRTTGRRPSRFTIEEPDQVKIPDDFLQRPTMAAVTGAIKLLRQRYPDVAIVGKVYGPWSVGYQMVGIESFLMDVMLDPDKIKRYLDAFVPACIASARAQFEAGADAVMWADHTTGDLCRAETYRDFLLEMHQRITQEMGGPGIFHCCGKTIDRVAPLRRGRLGRLPLRVAGRRPRGARGGR